MKDLILQRGTDEYEQLERLGKLHDMVLVGSTELALLTGYSVAVIRQGRVPLPKKVSWSGRQRWTMAEIRRFLLDEKSHTEIRAEKVEGRKRGRPSKKDEIKRRSKALAD